MSKIFIILSLVLFIVAPAMAADECIVTKTVGAATRNPQLTLTCNGTSGSTTIPVAMLQSLGNPRFLYAVETVPGTGGEEPSAYTVVITNANGSTILSLDARATDANEIASGDGTLGFFPSAQGPLSVAVGALGAGDTTVINLIFLQ